MSATPNAAAQLQSPTSPVNPTLDRKTVGDVAHANASTSAASSNHTNANHNDSGAAAKDEKEGKGKADKKMTAEKRWNMHYREELRDGDAPPLEPIYWCGDKNLPSLRDKNILAYGFIPGFSHPDIALVAVGCNKKDDTYWASLRFHNIEAKNRFESKVKLVTQDTTRLKDYREVKGQADLKALFDYLESEGRITPPIIRNELLKVLNPIEYVRKFEHANAVQPLETEYDEFRCYAYQSGVETIDQSFLPYVKKHFPTKYFEEAYKAFSHALESDFPEKCSFYYMDGGDFDFTNHSIYFWCSGLFTLTMSVLKSPSAEDRKIHHDVIETPDISKWIEFVKSRIDELDVDLTKTKAREFYNDMFAHTFGESCVAVVHNEQMRLCLKHFVYLNLLAKLYEKSKNVEALVESYKDIQGLLAKGKVTDSKIYQRITEQLVLFGTVAANPPHGRDMFLGQRDRKSADEDLHLERTEQFRAARDQHERKQAKDNFQRNAALEEAFNNALTLKVRTKDFNTEFQRNSIMFQLMRGYTSPMPPIPDGLSEETCPLVTTENLTFHLMREFQRVNKLLESTCLRVERLESENAALKAEVTQLKGAKGSVKDASASAVSASISAAASAIASAAPSAAAPMLPQYGVGMRSERAPAAASTDSAAVATVTTLAPSKGPGTTS